MEKQTTVEAHKTNFTIGGIKANEGRNDEIREYLKKHAAINLKMDTTGNHGATITDRNVVIYSYKSSVSEGVTKVADLNRVLRIELYKNERAALFILKEDENEIAYTSLSLSYDSIDALYNFLLGKGVNVTSDF